MGPVEIEVDGKVFVFRVPGRQDYILLDRELPLLPVDQQREIEALEGSKEEKAAAAGKVMDEIDADPERRRKFLERCDRLLLLVGIKPRLVEETDPDHGEDVYPMLFIDDGIRLKMALLLMDRSGFNREAAIEIRPLSGTNNSSGDSTPSPAGTGDSPATSSAAN